MAARKTLFSSLRCAARLLAGAAGCLALITLYLHGLEPRAVEAAVINFMDSTFAQIAAPVTFNTSTNLNGGVR